MRLGHPSLHGLPAILSVEKISRLLSSVANVKHKTILMLVYSILFDMPSNY